jgi:DNA polymerase-3 subunit delta'
MEKDGIIGHSRQLRILESLLWSGKVPHTLLFFGMPGIGKKIIARQFLNTLFCPGEKPPCLDCAVCSQVMNKTFPDIIELQPDSKGTIPIGSPEGTDPGSVRWLISRLSKKSLSGRYGVLIDGAEGISRAGQNALLKTIEEPQAGTVIIIVTSNKTLLLPTIISRCTVLPFNPLTDNEVKEVLAARDISADIDLLTDLAGGSVDIALMLAEEKTMAGIQEICREISSHLAGGSRLNLELSDLQKKIGIENTLTILTNIYRTMLLTSLSEDGGHPAIRDIAIADTGTIIKIIKILLALRKGLTNNLNIRNTLKGMLYSLDSITGFGLPELDQAMI